MGHIILFGVKMRIELDNGLFYAISRFEERFDLKDAGFHWNVGLRRWESGDFRDVEKLIEGSSVIIPPHVEDLMAKLRRKEKELLGLSSAIQSDLVVPVPEGRKLYPFQTAGVEFIHSHHNVLIADEMGLGKTVESLAYINLAHPSRIVVVAPKIAKSVWMNEAERWLTSPYKIVEVNGTAPVIMDNSINVMHYEQLLKYGIMGGVDLVIFDESHYLKNGRAKRTRAATALAEGAKKVVMLTGTPILNRPGELFSQLRILGSQIAKNWYRFAGEYIVFDNFKNQIGGKNLEELGRKLRVDCMLRREKKDVLVDLPNKVRQVIELPESEIDQKLIIENQRLLQKFEQYLTIGFENAARDGDEVRIMFEEMSEVRHRTALAKLPLLKEYVGELLEVEDKVVVFTYHRDVAKELAEYFGELAVLITGEVENREELVREFQDGDKRLFVATMKSAGISVTLTAASVCLFAELDWTPSTISQAEDRLHRIGQGSSVLSQFLVVKNTIDDRLAQKLVEKSKMIEEVMK